MSTLALSTVVFVGGCGSDTAAPEPPPTTAADEQTDDMIDEMTDAGDRARALALEAAHRTLSELDVELAAVDGATRVSTCTDSLGSSTDGRFGEYSSGAALESASISGDRLDALAERLDVQFLEDTVDVEGQRLIAFVLDVDGVEVIVRVSRLDSGAVTLTTTTPCVN